MRRLRKNEKALVFELLIAAAMAVVIFFALMNIGAYINSQISTSLTNTFPVAASRTAYQNNTLNQLSNITVGFDSNINIMTVAAVIVVITIPLAAVVAIKKLM
jgi:cytochrome c oxidase assembly protein Cox11